MLRERVASNIFVFTSELYAQVTAGAVITSAGAIVIDTLAFPSETRQIVQFIEERHGVPIRYVVNTHYHADHTYGTCLFRGARVVGHRLCYDLLNTRGREALEASRRTSREMADIYLRLPDIVFDKGTMNLHLGGTTLKMWHTPGHSPDGIVCLVEEERILFASDTLMPIPFFADGSWEDFVATLESLLDESFEGVVQGHGEVILRGEVRSRIEDDLHYLYTLRARVEELVVKGKGPEALASIGIEECGKSRIPLNGLPVQLHQANAEALYWALKRERYPETGSFARS
ncbi:MAG TPA: MBL fold metallo-hydrolase [Chloroflexi bacterium]|nr:MBL fold metallo-hydrolase [Chloroflexota bacterium]